MHRFFSQPFTFDRTVRIALYLLILLVIFIAVSTIWEVLLPFLLAGLFAYVVMPLVKLIQHVPLFRKRGVAVFIVFFLLVTAFTLGVLYLIPAIEAEIDKTMLALAQYSNGNNMLELIIPEHILESIRKAVDLTTVMETLAPDKLAEAGKTLWEQAGGIISGTLSVFSWSLVFAMGLVYFIFIMIDFEGLGNGLVDLFPAPAHPTLRAIMHDLDYYMNSYFRGQALIALSVGILFSIGFNIIGLPMATALGILMGLLNFIPYMQALGILPLTLVALLMAAQTGQNAFVCLGLAFGVLVIVQIIQETILVPHIMGSSMGMRPSLILLSLAIWGYLLGFFGMLVALPLTMALYSIYMRYVLRDEAYIRLLEEKKRRRTNKRSSQSSSTNAHTEA